MNDDDLAVLCIFNEAGNQPFEGQVAVGIVIRNRIALHFPSDGTMANTIEHGNGVGFSWVGFAIVDGRYTRVADGPDEIAARVQQLLTEAQATAAWSICEKAWADSGAWFDGQPLSFTPGPEFDKLDKQTVMYLNPAISSAAWATPDKEVAKIFDHTFFHA